MFVTSVLMQWTSRVPRGDSMIAVEEHRFSHRDFFVFRGEDQCMAPGRHSGSRPSPTTVDGRQAPFRPWSLADPLVTLALPQSGLKTCVEADIQVPHQFQSSSKKNSRSLRSERLKANGGY